MKVLCITNRSDRPEAELFVGLYESGVELTVCANPLGRYYAVLEKAGVRTIPMIVDSRFSPESIRSISRLLHTEHYDVVYCFNNKAISNTVFSLGRVNTRLITYRGVIGHLHSWSPASLTTHFHPRVRKIVCVCNAVRDYVNSRIAARGRAVTIYKGHRLEWYSDVGPVDLSSLGIDGDNFVVGFCGRNHPRKGFIDLAQSSYFLPRDLPIRFLFMGNMNENKRLVDVISKSPYRDRMHLLGYRDDALSVMASCDLLVFPSTEREGLAKVVLEAMSLGIPSIVTNVGCLPEIVEDGVSGLVVPPKDPEAIADAILRLFNDEPMRHKMGEMSQVRIKHRFNIEETIKKHLVLLEEVVNGHQRSEWWKH